MAGVRLLDDSPAASSHSDGSSDGDIVSALKSKSSLSNSLSNSNSQSSSSLRIPAKKEGSSAANYGSVALDGGDSGENDVEDLSAAAAGKATFHSAVFNLVNTIIGGGVLALPYVFSKVGMILGVVMLLAVAFTSTLSADMLVEASRDAEKYSLMDNAQSFKNLAKLTFGGIWGARIVDICMIVFLLGACIGYVIIIGDMLTPFVASLFFSDWESNPCKQTPEQLQAQDIAAVLVMLVVSVFILFPLMTLQRIDSLQYTSLVAICCIAFLVGTISILGIDAAGTTISERGDDIKLVYFSSDFFTVLPIMSFAFTFHMSIFPVLTEMRRPSHINWAIRSSVVICALAYSSVGFLGYLTFLGDLDDNILLTYGSDLVVISVGRVALGVIICFSYPLLGYPARVAFDTMIFGHRDAELARARGEEPLLLHVPLKRRAAEAGGFVFVTLILGILVPNISFMFGIIGSSVGNMMVYVLPATFYLFVKYSLWSKGSSDLRSLSADDSSAASRLRRFGTFVNARRREALPAVALVAIGLMLTVVCLITIFVEFFDGAYSSDVDQQSLRCN